MHTRRPTLGLSLFLGSALAATACRAQAVTQPAAPAAPQPAAPACVEVADFGRPPEGEAVRLFTLRNAGGLVAKIMERGATVTELWAPDRAGRLANVVFGADRLDAYLGGFNAGASVMGRFAGRIAFGRFTLDGAVCQVVTNRGPHHLHGGKKGFATAVWRGEALPPQARGASARFAHTSRDGDDGFPGTVEVCVTYTLTDANELWLEYAATTDRPTPINLTNHAYFNLAGAGVGDVCGTLLWVAADRVTQVDGLLIPTGEFADVRGTPLDFTAPAEIGSRLAQLQAPFTGYDHTYALRAGGRGLALAAWAFEPQSGRALQVLTTEPGLQVFTPKRYFGPDGKPLADVSALKHNAFCFETQHFPDSVNRPGFPSAILRPGQTFASTTVYRFSAQEASDAAQRLMQVR